MYEAAKATHKYGEKVQKKLKKSKSKHLEKYKDEYTDNLKSLKDELPFIDDVSIKDSVKELLIKYQNVVCYENLEILKVFNNL